VKVKILDYEGPTGLYIATGKEILPLFSVAGRIAAVGAAIQADIHDPEKAAVLQFEIDQAIKKAKVDCPFEGS
jgi:hypothetical protein